MDKFTRADASISAFAPLIALALIALNGCVSVHDRGVGVEPAFEALAPTTTGERRTRFQCPVRHVYVCERQLPTGQGTCYCAAEPTTLPSPDGLRRVF